MENSWNYTLSTDTFDLDMKREKQLTAAGFDGVKGLARLYKGGLIL